MKKLLVICGPTATGKTSLALALAKKFKGEIVSADSRQVYKGMDIGTGKGLPVNSKFEIRNSKLGGSYKVAGVPVWGYDLVDPKEGFSVADYINLARNILVDIERRGKLLILVGGTGLYIKAIVDGIPTAKFPKNEDLRKNLEDKSVDELFEMLAQLDPIHAGSMNTSDKKNPRRLIRAVEVAIWKLENKSSIQLQNLVSSFSRPASILFIGLTAPKEVLHKKIDERVNKRIKQGFEGEIKKLIKNGVSWENQSMDSLGYRQWRKYIEGEKTKEEAVEDWKREEKKYAKRQLTWFRRDSRINWFDIARGNYQKRVEKLVKKWYNR